MRRARGARSGRARRFPSRPCVSRSARSYWPPAERMLTNAGAPSRGPKPRLELCGFHGRAHEETLHHVAPEAFEHVPRLPRLDAFGDRLEAEVVCELDRGARDGPVLLV